MKIDLTRLQAASIPRLDWRDMFEFTEPLPEEAVSAMDAYFRRFAAPADKGKCLNCELVQGGLMSALIGGFTYAIQHGEGFCSRCKYPARANHYDIGPIRTFEAILQYHPDELTAKASAPAEGV